MYNIPEYYKLILWQELKEDFCFKGAQTGRGDKIHTPNFNNLLEGQKHYERGLLKVFGDL